MLRATCILFATACSSDPIEYYVPEEPPAPIELTYSATGIHKDYVEAGCEFWKHEGISCTKALDEEPDFYVEALWGCPDQETRPYGMHEKYEGEGYNIPGWISIYPECSNEDLDDVIVQVLAHEIGHAMGIYWHVWTDCETVAERPQDTPPICGRAIMNDQLDQQVLAETVPDHQAFQARNYVFSIWPYRD